MRRKDRCLRAKASPATIKTIKVPSVAMAPISESLRGIIEFGTQVPTWLVCRDPLWSGALAETLRPMSPSAYSGLGTSHNLIVPSRLAVAKTLPRELNAREKTVSECPSPALSSTTVFPGTPACPRMVPVV
jgi:hypothetical protein